MKNLFLINEEDRNRILNLHENATKRQYLTEQTAPNPQADAGTIRRELDKFNSDEQAIVDIIKNYNKDNFKSLLDTYKTINNVELGTDIFRAIQKSTDKAEIADLTKHLNSIGYSIEAGGYDSNTRRNIGWKITPNSETQAAEQNKTKSVEEFKNFPCVASHPNAKEQQMSNGSVVYLIDGVVYYSNGRKKMKDGKMANYTCNDPEFKQKGGSNVGGKVAVTTPSDADLDKFLNA